MSSSLNQQKENFEKELKDKLYEKAFGSTIEEIVLLKAFKYYDLPNRGFCTQDQFVRTMAKIGITSFSPEEVAEFYKLYNVNEENELDYREFVSQLYSNKSIKTKNVKNNVEPEVKPPQKEVVLPPSYNKKEFYAQDNVEDILKIIREKLASRGVQGVCAVARNFRIVDDNNSQTINFQEFKKCCIDFQFGLRDDQIEIAFMAFDRDDTGEIDYDEFLRTVRGEMNDFRKNLVQEAFNTLDINKNGEITFDELKSKYNASQHPLVLSGKKTEDQVLKDFMDTFQDTYNYLCGTETDNKITIEEFLEYYENVSMSIDDDEYFELLINNAWKLNNNTTYNNEKKGWTNKNELENENNNETLQQKYEEKFNNENEISDTPSIRKFRNEILKKGGGGLISLAKQFKLFDENGNKILEFNEFENAVNSLKLNVTEDELLKIFNYFDYDGSGYIDYEEFVRAIRGPMNKKRLDVVKQAFNKLDIDQSGVVDMYDIKTKYSAKNDTDVRSGKKTEEEVYSDFMNNFQNHHYIKSGTRSKRVTLEEFIEYYNNISMNIKDDDFFVFMVQNAWRLNEKAYSKPYFKEKNIPKTGIYDKFSENLNSQLRNRKKDFNSSEVPLGNKENENNIPEYVNIVNKFRDIISKRGSRGIMSVRREFMIADNDNSNSIDIKEFLKFCHDYKISLNSDEVNLLFNAFDTNKNGKLDYQEFLKGVVGELNEKRKKIVRQVFNTFDRDNNDLVNLDEVRNAFEPANHPEVKNGKKTEDEVLAEFLDTFEYQFSLLNTDNNKSEKIGFNDLLDYFSNLSVSIKDDDYFEEIVRGVFNLDNRKPNKRAWRPDFNKIK